MTVFLLAGCLRVFSMVVHNVSEYFLAKFI